ncbi:unnamed protein product [Pleuronectes platessa]|uniref:Uncharacterized protein n=1 Tax=Pleuronectes platessa TaxID=8262 RepID=A0A9N7U2X2_PLEPL|nr:unnamed protein product [Pleuronectes platessa]
MSALSRFLRTLTSYIMYEKCTTKDKGLLSAMTQRNTFPSSACLADEPRLLLTAQKEKVSAQSATNLKSSPRATAHCNREMEGGAAEVGESQMDITLTFEEWKANKRVTGEEGKLNLPFRRVSPLRIRHGFHEQCPNDRTLVNREVKNRLSNGISLHITTHASHRETTEETDDG